MGGRRQDEGRPCDLTASPPIMDDPWGRATADAGSSSPVHEACSPGMLPCRPFVHGSEPPQSDSRCQVPQNSIRQTLGQRHQAQTHVLVDVQQNQSGSSARNVELCGAQTPLRVGSYAWYYVGATCAVPWLLGQSLKNRFPCHPRNLRAAPPQPVSIRIYQ